jgi:hypothetical protein
MARTILTRCLAVLALFFVYGAYLVGATVLMATTSTQAQARRRGRGGVGIYLGGGYPAYGGYRGYGYSPYVAPGPRCYWSRRWRRTICRY